MIAISPHHPVKSPHDRIIIIIMHIIMAGM